VNYLNKKKYVEVQPVKYKSHGITVLYYDRVKNRKIFNINIGNLQTVLNSYAKQGMWKVRSRKGTLYFRFHMTGGTKPLIIILDDGRFYATIKEWDTLDHQFIRHQAGMLYELLENEKLVFNARKRYFAFKKYGKRIKEEIPPENTPKFIRNPVKYDEWLQRIQITV